MRLSHLPASCLLILLALLRISAPDVFSAAEITPAALSAPTPSSTTLNSSFVQAHDQSFYLDGKPFRYLGGNNYPLVQHDYSADQLDSFFAQCRRCGLLVVRTWAFNRRVPATSAGGDFICLEGDHLRYNEATFQFLDRVLARARAAGIKLILVLQDNNGGHKAEWCRWSNLLHGTACDTKVGDDFHTDPSVQADFQDYIRRFVTRVNTCDGLLYRDDPTIFAWELINEGRYTGNDNALGDDHPGTLASSRVVAMTRWYAATSAFLKGLDPHHLVGTGSISQYADYTPDDPVHNGTYYGLDYRAQHALPDIDYFDFHFYPYRDPPAFGLRAYGQNALGNSSAQPTEAGLLAQLRQFISDAHAAGKPVTIGEYGVDRRDTSTSDPFMAYPRATNFARFVSAWFAAGGDGFTIWHFSNLLDDNNYTVFPGAPHTGENANANANDDDADLLKVLQDNAPGRASGLQGR